MIVTAFAAVFVAGGLIMLLRGVFAPPPRLDAIADGSYREAARLRASGGPLDILKSKVLTFLPTDTVVAGDLAPDLAIRNKTEQAHIIEKFTFGAVGAFFPTVAWVLAQAIGLDLSFAFAIIGGAVLVVPAFMFPDIALRDQANELRDEFLAAFAAYLDLCRILLGASDGPETALEKAAERGDGWAFQMIRSALLLAKGDASVKHWDALGALGEEINVRELREFAAAMSMTATSSSQPQTLAARAASLRDQVLKGIAGDAEQATERMDVPLTALTMAFTIFLMVAALNQESGFGTSYDGEQSAQTVTVVNPDGSAEEVEAPLMNPDRAPDGVGGGASDLDAVGSETE